MASCVTLMSYNAGVITNSKSISHQSEHQCIYIKKKLK